MYLYKQDLPLNSLKWLICHKTEPNQTKPLPNIVYFLPGIFYYLSGIWYLLNFFIYPFPMDDRAIKRKFTKYSVME